MCVAGMHFIVKTLKTLLIRIPKWIKEFQKWGNRKPAILFFSFFLGCKVEHSSFTQMKQLEYIDVGPILGLPCSNWEKKKVHSHSSFRMTGCGSNKQSLEICSTRKNTHTHDTPNYSIYIQCPFEHFSFFHLSHCLSLFVCLTHSRFLSLIINFVFSLGTQNATNT